MSPHPYDPRNPGAHNLSARAYDPAKLIHDVVALLEDRGLQPVLPEGGSRVKAETAASQLLRMVGITPAMAQQDALALDGGARYSERMHGD